MANKHKKKCPLALIVREMQIKIQEMLHPHKYGYNQRD